MVGRGFDGYFDEAMLSDKLGEPLSIVNHALQMSYLAKLVLQEVDYGTRCRPKRPEEQYLAGETKPFVYCGRGRRSVSEHANGDNGISLSRKIGFPTAIAC
jgi:hypothetical protein